jgi:hypothetical protein
MLYGTQMWESLANFMGIVFLKNTVIQKPQSAGLRPYRKSGFRGTEAANAHQSAKKLPVTILYTKKFKIIHIFGSNYINTTPTIILGSYKGGYICHNNPVPHKCSSLGLQASCFRIYTH